MCSAEKVFLKIPQISRENICQNLVFNKFLRAPFFIENLWWLILVVTRVLQNGSFEKSHRIRRKTQVPEFSFSKVPDSHPTALANPFLVLSCEFCGQFQNSYFEEHHGKTTSDIGFRFYKITFRRNL